MRDTAKAVATSCHGPICSAGTKNASGNVAASAVMAPAAAGATAPSAAWVTANARSRETKKTPATRTVARP